jgi:glutamate-1-semialdehyde 2,1-aminomutase
VNVQRALANAERLYVEATPRSLEAYERACLHIPGGTTRNTVFFEPHPLYLDHGWGCYAWDVDNTRRLDMIGNYSAQILGYAHPAVADAVRAQMEKGTAFAAATCLEAEFAELLCDRVPSFEQVRFTNSGTEATMFALRLARVHTGRRKIARMEGGYHGTHDYAEISTNPTNGAGPADAPLAVPDSPGTPEAVVRDTVILPFNNLERSEHIIRRNAHQLAAVIVEPVMGLAGMLTPEAGYLERLRSLTRELGIVLVFDEIISLRVSPGGAQELYGVVPDLTAAGKMLGGGFPIGVFGGRSDIMVHMVPGRSGAIPHGGTFNGNALVLAAGLAAMRQLTPAIYGDLNAMGDALRKDLRSLFADHNIPAQVNGVASLANVHFAERPVTSYRDKLSSDTFKQRAFFLGLMNNGVLLSPRGMIALSTAHTSRDLKVFLDAVDRVVGSWSAGY